MRVAITGVNGVLGGFLAERLAQRGVQITGLAGSATGIPGVDRWVIGRLTGSSTRADLWTRLLADADACLHCAFEHTPGRYRHGEGADPQQFWSGNLGNTLALLEAAVARDLPRVLLLSSRAVFDGYADHSAEPLSLADGAALRPTTHYGALKAAEEALAARYSAETGLIVSGLRTTGVYGVRNPLENSKWFDLLRDLRAGHPPPPRSATEVHGHDLADAALLLLNGELTAVAGRIYNCSDVLVTHQQLVTLFNRVSGARIPLPEPGLEPRVRLDCTALRGLGWRPRGPAGVEATVQTLLGR